MENDKKAVDEDQTDDCRYLTRRFRSKGQDQLLFEASTINGQKFDNCQHAVDILWSDGCVTMDGNAKGCC